MKPFGIFSPPTTTTQSCRPLATSIHPVLKALPPAAQPGREL
jgi:hypothetical protein